MNTNHPTSTSSRWFFHLWIKFSFESYFHSWETSTLWINSISLLSYIYLYSTWLSL